MKLNEKKKRWVENRDKNTEKRESILRKREKRKKGYQERDKKRKKVYQEREKKERKIEITQNRKIKNQMLYKKYALNP